MDEQKRDCACELSSALQAALLPCSVEMKCSYSVVFLCFQQGQHVSLCVIDCLYVCACATMKAAH